MMVLIVVLIVLLIVVVIVVVMLMVVLVVVVHLKNVDFLNSFKRQFKKSSFLKKQFFKTDKVSK